MNTISSHSALGDLTSWNQPAAAATPATTLQQAQQTVAQTPATILSSFVPANTSFYGTTPAVDSLLGNIGTSAGLNALAQINASRSASTQINPYSSAESAVSDATESLAASKASLIASALSSVGSTPGGGTSAILSAYYPATVATSASSLINVTG